MWLGGSSFRSYPFEVFLSASFPAQIVTCYTFVHGQKCNLKLPKRFFCPLSGRALFVTNRKLSQMVF
jgi:hypothetical protein